MTEAEDKTGFTPDDWRAGDRVLHKPSGETWVVAYVDGDYLAWCGWPEGEAKVSDCTLVKRCSDDEHIKQLESLANSRGKRSYRAQAALARARGEQP